jgi:fructoselysine-6-P-deglycase FrlB-like protein
MSDLVDYLTEDTYRPDWLQEGVIESTLDIVAENKPKILELGKKLAEAKRFYLIGSGGSYSVQLPLVYIGEKYTKVPVHAFSGWSFLENRPEAIDEEAVVILISQSGKTKEILEALEWCNMKGATTFGLTQKQESAINLKADIGYGWEARGVTLGKLMTLYYLFGSIFKEKGYGIGQKMIDETDKLPGLIPDMIPIAKENSRIHGFDFKDYPIIFIVGGGINWGLTYQFAVSTLMEMCWTPGIAVDYSEFRHGPLELFTEGTACVFLRGRSDLKPLEDSIIEFSRENRVKIIEYNSQGLDLDNLLTPFTLFIELEWFSYYLSLAKNRRMGSYRFYDKVKF